MKQFKKMFINESKTNIVNDLKKIYVSAIKGVKGKAFRVLDDTDTDPELYGSAVIWLSGYRLDGYPLLDFNQETGLYGVEYEDDFIESDKIPVIKKALKKFQKQWEEDN